MIFDHLYFGLDEDRFNIECAKHVPSSYAFLQSVRLADDAWDGLYVRLRTKTYLEFLNKRRENCFGLAFRSDTPMEDGVPIEVKLNTNLNWKQGTRFAPNGKFWFHWFSLEDYKNDLNLPFNFWMMQTSKEAHLKLTQTPFNTPYSNIETVRMTALTKHRPPIRLRI